MNREKITKVELNKLRNISDKFNFEYEARRYEPHERVCNLSVTFFDETGEDNFFNCLISYDDDEEEKTFATIDRNYIYEYDDVDELIDAFMELIKKEAFIDALVENNEHNISYFRNLGGEGSDSYQVAIKRAVYKNKNEDVKRLLETGKIDTYELIAWLETVEIENSSKAIVQIWVLNKKLNLELIEKEEKQPRRQKI